jgi:signal transduction histidine kinase
MKILACSIYLKTPSQYSMLPEARRVVRLSEFIRTDTERIVREWEEFAKTLPAEADLPRWFLRVHIAAILRSIAEEIERSEPAFEQQAKGRGEGTAGPIEHVAAAHLDLRIESGFDLVQIMAEYRALRACVLRLWRAKDPDGFVQGAEEITRFCEAVDRAVAETVPAYEQRDARYRDRFLAMLGHDLRNPLNSISLSAMSLAGAEGLNEKQQGAASRILSSAQRLNNMVNDILDFARGRLGSPMPITRVKANLGTLAREVADEVRSANPEFLVDVETQGDLNGDWDGERVKQLLSNLLTNAVQHGAGKNVGLSVKGEENLVFLEVRNEGPPIRKELLGTMFDPLVQGRSSTQNPTGLGLGLFIVKEIASAHKGTVSVTSSEDSGTTFSVSLPRH